MSSGHSRPGSPNMAASTYGRRVIMTLLSSCVIGLALALWPTSFSPKDRSAGHFDHSLLPTQSLSADALASHGPRASFKTNLRPDRHYLTTYYKDGWTNQVIDFEGLIYIAFLSGRIPIVPPFLPNFHLGDAAKYLPVSEIFDLPFLSRSLHDLPIIELDELKAEMGSDVEVYTGCKPNGHDSECLYSEEPEPETLGCWSQYEGFYGHPEYAPNAHGLTFDFTPMPYEVYYENNFVQPLAVRMAHLVAPGRPYQKYESSLDILQNNHLTPPTVDPEDHVACFDTTFFPVWTPGHAHWQDRMGGLGAWNTVGRYIRFTPRMRELAADLLHRTFGLSPDSALPPYAAIHIRRTDIGEGWKHLTPRDYAYVVSQLIEELKRDRGITVSHILVTTDETDPEWIETLLMMKGFYIVDHVKEQTVQRLGPWYPALLDSVMLSSARAFVGISGSTMSMVAYRRVLDLQSGTAVLMAESSHAPQGWVWPY